MASLTQAGLVPDQSAQVPAQTPPESQEAQVANAEALPPPVRPGVPPTRQIQPSEAQRWPVPELSSGEPQSEVASDDEAAEAGEDLGLEQLQDDPG